MANAYLLLTKPGIILGNLVTVVAGFFLASQGAIDWTLLASTLLGLALVIASACAYNNYIDRTIDKAMVRTNRRPLATGELSNAKALLFGAILGALGLSILALYTNVLTCAVAFIGFLTYVFLYSLCKRHTVYATALGSISGAVPPIVGYTAVADSLDGGALILFLMMIFWQMPHFFSIALMHLDDYARAGIPTLPLTKGLLRTKIHMSLYIAAFIATSALLTFFEYTGDLYLAVVLSLGSLWLLYSCYGFFIFDVTRWSKQMFRLSLATIFALSFAIVARLS